MNAWVTLALPERVVLMLNGAHFISTAGAWATSSGVCAEPCEDEFHLGILTPGARVSPFSGQVVAWRDGVPVEIGELGHVMSRLRRS